MDGLIVAAYGRRFDVETDDRQVFDCVTRGKRNDYACGDTVSITTQSGGQGVIDDAMPRKSLLYRSDVWREKLIAANVSQALIVLAPVPSFDTDVLNPCLAAAEYAGIRVQLILNKVDLPEAATAEARLQVYVSIGYPVIRLSAHDSVDPLRELIHGERNVLVGESGMGKSTILNGLIPQAAAATGEVSRSLGTGKHTTTQSRLFWLGEDRSAGSIIDTPGLQAFGVQHVPVEALADCFREFRPLLDHCRFRNCRHHDEPDCAVQAAADEDRIDPARLKTYRQLLRSALRAREALTNGTRQPHYKQKH